MSNFAYIVFKEPIIFLAQGKFGFPNPFPLFSSTIITVLNKKKGLVQISYHPFYKNLVGIKGSVDQEYLTTDYLKKVRGEKNGGHVEIVSIAPTKGYIYTFDGTGTSYAKNRLNGTVLKCLSVQFNTSAMLLWAKFEILSPNNQVQVVRLNRDKIFWALH